MLFSIGFGSRGARLHEIIAAGDMLNHAVITRAELENGLNRLLDNGYIGCSEERFYATDKARRFYRENKKFAEGSIAEWLRMAQILAKQPAQAGESGTIKITDEAYRDAVNRYVRTRV